MSEESYALKEIKLEVTDHCNLLCTHCSSNASAEKHNLVPFDKALGIVQQAIEMGVEKIAYSGGEPLLWPGIFDLVCATRTLGVAPTVYTTGVVDGSLSAMKRLKKAGAGKVVFSVYAGGPDIHDKVTNSKGSFKTTLVAADECVSEGIETEFHFVPMRPNYAQLPSVLALARAHHVKCVSVLRFVPQGRGRDKDDLALTREQNIELRKMILRGSTGPIAVRTGSPYNFLIVNACPNCFAARDRLVVTPDLRIYPCDAFKQLRAEDMVGTDEFSRLDKWTLQECWEKSQYLCEVRRHLSTAFESPCAECKILTKCWSGCLAQKRIANGCMRKAPDPMCILEKACPQRSA